MERKGHMISAKKQISVLKLKCLLILSVFTASCATLPEFPRLDTEAEVESLKVDVLYNLPRPEQQPVVAIYGGAFADFTGQRKSNSELSLIHI